MSEKRTSRKQILGVNVDTGYRIDEVVRHIDGLIQKKKGTHLISTTNPYFIMSAQADPDFRQIVNRAELSLPDGVGVLYASYYLDLIKNMKRGALFSVKAFFTGLYAGMSGYIDRKRIGNTITGVDLSEELFKLANEKGYSLYFLGGGRRDKEGNVMLNEEYDLATDAINRIKTRYPNVRIAGATSAFKKEEAHDSETVNYIHNDMKKNNINNIDILLVAYNPVNQEKWIHRNADKLPATICIGVGRTFNYITNDMRKPPLLCDKLHIAWLYAFMQQTWRFKRVFMSFPIFPIKIYLESIKKQ